MSLREIYCQDKAIGILQKALAADKSAHAYIFAGHDGIGRLKTAKQWAKLLLCEKPVIENNFADSCASCRSCELFDADSHPDFNLIYKELREFTKDGKGKPPPVEMPIDVIREFLLAKVPQKPTLSAKKIFIVTEAEKLNAASQNALLKVLEEPPAYCCIILICSRMEKLLPTTRSRCQTIRFSPIDQDLIIENLKQLGLDRTKAAYFARLAQGSLGQAHLWAKLELADAGIYQTKTELLNSLANYKYADSLDLAQQILAESKKIASTWSKLDNATSKTDINRRAQKILIRIIISALSDAMRLNTTENGEIINSDQHGLIQKIAAQRSSEESAKKIADTCEAMQWVDSSVNERLIFEQLLLNLGISDKIQV